LKLTYHEPLLDFAFSFKLRRFMKETYCGTIGYEYMHIPDRDMCNWQGLALALGTATRSNRS